MNGGKKMGTLLHSARSLSRTPIFARLQVNTGWGDFLHWINSLPVFG